MDFNTMTDITLGRLFTKTFEAIFNGNHAFTLSSRQVVNGKCLPKRIPPVVVSMITLLSTEDDSGMVEIELETKEDGTFPIIEGFEMIYGFFTYFELKDSRDINPSDAIYYMKLGFSYKDINAMDHEAQRGLLTRCLLDTINFLLETKN